MGVHYRHYPLEANYLIKLFWFIELSHVAFFLSAQILWYLANMKKFICVSVLFLSLVACDSVKRNSESELQAVGKVDVERFLGTWHVAARMPSFFEKDCINSSAVYSATDNPGVVGVTNICDDKDNPGEEIVVKGEARPTDETNAKLKVRLDMFPGNLVDGNLWVVHLDEDYQWVVLSEPRGKYLWIMGRDKIMSAELLDELIAWAEADGWDTSHLIIDNSISKF